MKSLLKTLYSQSQPQGTKANPAPPEKRTQRLLRGAMVMTTPRRLRDLPLLDALIESQEGDFLTAVAGPLATRTFCTLLDVPFSDESPSSKAGLETWLSALG